jgi:DNA-binding IclR family transcriptional regulator
VEHTAFCIEARRAMRELVEHCGETTHLAVLDGTQVLFVEKLQATPAVEILLSRVGARLSAHAVGVGKVLLASQASYRLPALLDRLSLIPCTPQTIISRERLLQELEQVRKLGYAYDREETAQGLCCVAHPFMTWMGGSRLLSVCVSQPLAFIRSRIITRRSLSSPRKAFLRDLDIRRNGQRKR